MARMCSPTVSIPLLQMLVKLTQAKTVVEVGVFTGRRQPPHPTHTTEESTQDRLQSWTASFQRWMILPPSHALARQDMHP